MNTVFAVILCILFASSTMALDVGGEKPTSKDWIMITDIHFMDKRSVKRIKPNVYQARVCHSSTDDKVTWWVHFRVRVDCSSRQAWLESGKKWIGPKAPTKYDEGVMKVVCK
jgi:hypothetical protein